MKVFAFILSAYLLFLFATPCCSFDNCPEEKTAQQSDQKKGGGGCGSCSPFFTCAGCSGFTASIENSNFEIETFTFFRHYTGYILCFIPDVHYDFWQPPKLG